MSIALISCAVVFAFANSSISHDAAHLKRYPRCSAPLFLHCKGGSFFFHDAAHLKPRQASASVIGQCCNARRKVFS